MSFTYRDLYYGALDIRRRAGDRSLPWFRSLLLQGTGASRAAEFVFFLDSGFQELDVHPYLTQVLARDLSLTRLGDRLESLDVRDQSTYLRQETTSGGR
jgi:hypothetical protein